MGQVTENRTWCQVSDLIWGRAKVLVRQGVNAAVYNHVYIRIRNGNGNFSPRMIHIWDQVYFQVRKRMKRQSVDSLVWDSVINRVYPRMGGLIGVYVWNLVSDRVMNHVWEEGTEYIIENYIARTILKEE